MPFCACVCPCAYAYALVKTRPTLFRLKTHTFDAFRPSVHINTMRFENALEVGQNENTYISCWCGRSKTHQNENNDRKYRRPVCWQHGRGLKIKSQRAILSFLNVLTVENSSKRQCGRESIDAFSMTTKTHQCGSKKIELPVVKAPVRPHFLTFACC